MRLNDGKFRDNGGVGYLLKPACLRTGAPFHPDTGPFPAVGMKLTVQVCVLLYLSLFCVFFINRPWVAPAG